MLKDKTRRKLCPKRKCDPLKSLIKSSQNTNGKSHEENKLNLHVQKYCGTPAFSFNFVYLFPPQTNAKPACNYF